MHESRERPAGWVMRHLGGVTAGGHVLDVACGGGRHIGPCLRRGLQVTGIDRDCSAARRRFEGHGGLQLIETDLEDGSALPFGEAGFDAVLAVNYLWRPILPALVAAVRPDGILLYQTFREGNERYGKPSNPNFLLRAGELLDTVAGRLVVIAYQDGRLTDPGGPSRVCLIERIAAVGPDHRWVNEPPEL